MFNFEHIKLKAMKRQNVMIVILILLLLSCGNHKRLEGVYRYCWGEKGGFTVWIVDGYKVRKDIYKEFLYGGNDQRYIFNPRGEIWIDHAVSCEEFELTLAHELNERHLMAKLGWTYNRAHDSSLAIEVVMRRKNDSICRMHENLLHKVSPTDHSNRKEIHDLPDSIHLQHIYRVPLGERKGVAIWVVDGYLVRKNIFPDFGFSGNDKGYHFIPKDEIWIDGQISAEETEYSITQEEIMREQMTAGKTYDEAYALAIDNNTGQRDNMEKLISSHPPIVIPDSVTRYAGVVDPLEK